MKVFWMVIAGVCIAIAAALILRRDFDTAFMVAIAGVVAWFLNYRIQMKKIVAAADLEKGGEEEETDEQT